MRQLIILLMLLGAAGAASGQVYKWVDKDGNVHYSDQPPPEDQAAEKVDTSASELSAAQQAEAERLRQQLQDQASQRRESDAEAAQQAAAQRAEARKQAEQKQAVCKRAREQLDVMVRFNAVYTTNADGEREYMDDATRDARMAQLREQIARECG